MNELWEHVHWEEKTTINDYIYLFMYLFVVNLDSLSAPQTIQSGIEKNDEDPHSD
jgi:hypothetical protein